MGGFKGLDLQLQLGFQAELSTMIRGQRASWFSTTVRQRTNRYRPNRRQLTPSVALDLLRVI
jgi:hypothetical protein